MSRMHKQSDQVNDESSTRPFTEAEDKFIIENFRTMKDKDMGVTLGRSAASIACRRARLKLPGKNIKKAASKPETARFLASVDDTERKAFFEREVRNSASFKALHRSLEQDELEHYVEKYVSFMMDPTIETMTTMEKDALHQLLINEIRINRFLEEEKIDKALAQQQQRAPISRAREIRECQEVIMKAQRSLNVEREQRLKDQNDQALTFTNLIRDLKNPLTRQRVGVEAVVLKFIAEQTYNDNLGSHIISGKEEKFNTKSLFRKGQEPEQLRSDFLPTVGESSKEVDGDGPTDSAEGHS